MSLVTCSKCNQQNSPNEMYHCSGSNTELTYECADEKSCMKRRYNAEQDGFRIKREAQEDENKDYMGLPMDEFYEEKYGLCFEDLIKSDRQARDGCTRYIDDEGKEYKWHLFKKYWTTTK